jgi:GNAT superfamily N-acetyltransferase
MTIRTVPTVDVREINPLHSKALKEFVLLPKAIYSGNKNFVEPIYSEVARFIARGPFNKIGEKQLYLAYRDGRPVARLSVHRSHAHNDHYQVNQGFFGFFEAEDDSEAAAALFARGESWLRSRGCASVVGPMNFTIYDEIGLLINAFDRDPVVLCTYNPPYYAQLIETLGFNKEVDWYAYWKDLTIPNIMRLITNRVTRQKNVVIRPVNLRKFAAEAASIRHIFDEAWSENWGNVPFTDDQWNLLLKELRMVIKPDYCFIAEVDGQPVAFSITILDINQAVKKAKGKLFPFGLIKLLWNLNKPAWGRTMVMGILKPYRNKGYDVAMIQRTIEAGIRNGKTGSDCSLIVETNTPMIAALDHIGAERYKTYRIYKKNL